MRILITGASSFTGFWFAQALHVAGHEIVAPLRAEPASYRDGVRARRVEMLARHARIEWGAAFGSDAFLALADSGSFDVLCHHAAQVGDYRSPDFDVPSALGANTHRLPEVLTALRERGLAHVVLTGSVFEHGEGAGPAPRRAFSPYGVSKGLTAEVFRYWCDRLGVELRKFVIPNPFGMLEEPRFCAYLLRMWRAGQTATVQTPDYVRDNIHVDLLAKAYARFVGEARGPAYRALNPSGYVETQGAFAQRFASRLAPLLEVPCRVELLAQKEFSEPLMRTNVDSARTYVTDWDEDAAWRQLAQYYRAEYFADLKT